MMSKLKLTVNESKTRVCRLPEEKVDFLAASVYVWSMLLAEDGAGLLGYHSLQETSAAFV